MIFFKYRVAPKPALVRGILDRYFPDLRSRASSSNVTEAAFPNLGSVSTMEHLGVMVDSRLSWTDLIDRLGSSLSITFFSIRRVKHVGTEDVVRTAYNSLFMNSCRNACKELEILTVTNVSLLEVICLATSRQQKRHVDTHAYQTRNARNFALPIHYSRHFQLKPSYAGAKFFNILPDMVKRADPVTLKKKLQG
ncbi:hypothetical protein J6590_007751 [Homalodisca vitripennis]|nr:hypothetical protein J6590_007751 [Homalodisca vitripennis]